MPRSTAPRSRAAVADVPRTRNRFLLVLGGVIGSLVWVAVAGAQQSAPVTEPGAINASAAGFAAAEQSVMGLTTDVGVVATSASHVNGEPIGPTMPSGTIRYLPRIEQPTLVLRPATADDKRMQDQNPGLRRNLALIGVGVAAMFIGGEVDDGAGSLIVLTGAGLSLYGLYLILR